jgi:hypothetical protein
MADIVLNSTGAQQIANIINGELSQVLTCYPSFSETIQVDESEIKDLPLAYVQSMTGFDSDSQQASYGNIKSIRAVIFCFGQTAKETVETMLKIVSLGFTTIEGNIGYPSEAPFLLNGQTIFKWFPIGSVEETAEKYGNIWTIEQGFIFEYKNFKI